MGKLAEYLRTEADTIRAAGEKRRRDITAWAAAVDELFSDLRSWLRQSDPGGLMEVSDGTTAGADPALGEHRVPVLRIGVGDRVIEIVPRAWHVAGTVRTENEPRPFQPRGLVEIRDSGDPVRSLYRHPDGRWFIQNPPPAAGYARPLDQERFEEAVWDVLR